MPKSIRPCRNGVYRRRCYHNACRPTHQAPLPIGLSLKKMDQSDLTVNRTDAMILIREATKEDNDDLLTLTRQTPMHGIISLRIDREPDFFSLLKRRGAYKVFTAVSHDQLLGAVSISYQEVWINGHRKQVGYIGDMKVHPDFRGSFLAFRLMAELYKYLLTETPDLVLCLTARGNHEVETLLEGRLGLPGFCHVGHFKVYEMLPSPRRKTNATYRVAKVEENDLGQVCLLLNEYYKNYQVAPVIEPHHLTSTVIGAVYQKGEMIGAICLTDTDQDRQNVVMAIPIGIKLALSCLRFASLFFPLGKFPGVGDPIRMLYIKYIGFREGHDKAFDLLIQFARNVAYQQHYAFLTIGLYERDKLMERFKKYPKFSFTSNLFALDLKRNDLLRSIETGLFYEDFSLI